MKYFSYIHINLLVTNKLNIKIIQNSKKKKQLDYNDHKRGKNALNDSQKSAMTKAKIEFCY